MIIDVNNSSRSVGGKAFQLSRLARSYEVPPFITVSFQSLDEIGDLDNQKAIENICELFHFDMVAVRSSASCEDSTSASFAGLFKTVLNVPLPEIIPSIYTVLESRDSERVKEYMAARNIISTLTMTVIIQKMVDSRVSGVCITRNENREEHLIVEACYGLGELLVSGQITPDTYVVDRNSLAVESTTIGYQQFALYVPGRRYSNRDELYEEIPFHRRNMKKLSDEEICQVCKCSLEIEPLLGFDAADVEWAFENSQLYILQARPYTPFILKSRGLTDG